MYPKQYRPKRGDVFGRWTVIREVEPAVLPLGQKVRMVFCRCACGKKQNVQLYRLYYRQGRGCIGCANAKHFTRVGRYVVPTIRFGGQTYVSRIKSGLTPRQAKRKGQICHRCGRKGHTRKQDCRFHAVADRIRKELPGISRQRVLQLVHKEFGLCTLCSRKAVTAMHCAVHHKTVKRLARRRNAK